MHKQKARSIMPLHRNGRMLRAIPARMRDVTPDAASNEAVPGVAQFQLERFRAKWIPVRVKKTRQYKQLELRL